MSVLTLLRHGQASYMSQDYDKLSTLGEEQCRKVARFWIRHGVTFECVWRGPSKRHQQSADIIAQEFAQAGVDFPEAVPMAELDEFDAFRMMKVVGPLIAQKDANVKALSDAFERDRHTPEAGRLLQKLFEAVCRAWCTGEFDSDPTLESWSGFRERVRRALAAIREQTPPSSSVLAVTSGGPIAAAVGNTLDLPNHLAIEFVWLSRNCSFTELLFNHERVSVHSYNSVPHLDDRALLTYR